ncbi:MAG: methyltransferase domain-containing protein [Pseudonocardiales bacterium]
MTTVVDRSARLRAAMTQTLIDRGALTDPGWCEAFAAVPREVFVPRFARREQRGALVNYDVTDPGQAEKTLGAVYSDTSLLTRFDAGGTAISSSTQPSLMAIMLERLDVCDDMTVLEIGAGTGYHAALLAHRLGDARVTSIDVDPDLVSTAKEALNVAGYQPTLLVGNGAGGVPGRAPFDRIIATCGVSRIPPTWLAQVRPGGKILANLGLGLILLTVDEDGTATGRFDTEPAAFMRLRHDASDIDLPTADLLALADDQGAAVRSVEWLAEIDDPVVEFLTELILPGMRRVTVHAADRVQVLVDSATGSWARATEHGDATTTLAEGGPRALRSELAAVIADWRGLGHPAVADYALLVDADGTHHLHHPATEWALTLGE